MTEGKQEPKDLIPMRKAIELTGKSRTWVSSHVDVWTKGRNDFVSESEVLTALREYETPKPKQ